MTQYITGSECWWKEKLSTGIPAIDPVKNGQCQVTFWWRDPQGNEQSSPVKRVWIYITGVTDHHQLAVPCSLQRQTGTDVWCWQTRLNASWRGSYCLIPSESEAGFSAAALHSPPDPTALREGWRKLLPQAIADPCNPHSWRGNRGHPVSALHLPLAPSQPGWDHPAAHFSAPRCIVWHSQRLQNRRQVWIFTSGVAAANKRPLAILLDGQFWAQRMPVWPAIEAQTLSGALPPACYLLIDAIDPLQRGRELTCNPDFWLAVQDELLPLLRRQQLWCETPATTVVAGQSFGGLSALYAGLHWPEVFGCVLSQSGSFWWPHGRASHMPGQLTQQLATDSGKRTPLRIYLETGLREPVIYQSHGQLLPLLRKTPHKMLYREVEGGHDALCWRGGLLDGLSALWLDKPALLTAEGITGRYNDIILSRC